MYDLKNVTLRNIHEWPGHCGERRSRSALRKEGQEVVSIDLVVVAKGGNIIYSCPVAGHCAEEDSLERVGDGELEF